MRSATPGFSTKDLDDPECLAARSSIQKAANRADGIDHLLAQYDVQALVMPSRPPAFLIDALYGDSYPDRGIGAGWMAAISGYPIATVPMGNYRGLPLGLGVMAGSWDDARTTRGPSRSPTRTNRPPGKSLRQPSRAGRSRWRPRHPR